MISFLGEFEQLLLLAIIRCGDEAYGAALQRELEQVRRGVHLGAVYTTLLRLESKGLVASRVGDPTAERGGRRKKFYRILPAGSRQLERSLAALRTMTAGLPRPLEAP
ncbi:MAG: PadR family transcriptional regulator [Gemmatimonadota bacterium]